MASSGSVSHGALLLCSPRALQPCEWGCGDMHTQENTYPWANTHTHTAMYCKGKQPHHSPTQSQKLANITLYTHFGTYKHKITNTYSIHSLNDA